MTKKIESTPEAWESGDLGLDDNYVAKANTDELSLNEALELQMISIRLQKSLIDDLKIFAQLEGLGYQPLIKRILIRWIEGEKRTIANKCIAEVIKEQKAEEEKKAVEQNLGDKKIA